MSYQQQHDLCRRSYAGFRNLAHLLPIPCGALVSQFYEVRPLLDAAIGDAHDSLDRARTLAATLGQYDITLTVPPAGG